MFRTHADHINAVLLDLTLSDVSGDEVFRQIQTIRPNLKVILPSAYTEQEIISTFQDDGPAGFIQKRCQVVELVDKVRDLLSRAKA